ncbi:MAG: ABC transporter substrate-binding protein [Dehalococcoidia bacterium]|nr:ABC transporter substrate-binding protein [Dehalococcoidia bacterium]
MNARQTWESMRLGRRQALRGAGIGLAGLSAAALIGCGDSDEADSTTATATGTSEGPGAAPSVTTPDASARSMGGTLKVALGSDPTGLDPSTSRGGGDHHYLYSIFDNLVNNGPDFSVKPGLATEWEVVDDLTIRFKIQDGRTFHDGSPVTAEDVKYTIDRHKDPETQSYSAGQVESVESVEVVDDTTAIFHLNTITSPIFAILGDRNGMIMPKEATQAMGADYNNKPIASGPFKVDSWAVDANVKLSRFAEYAENYPYLDAIDVQVVPNSSVQFANLRTGDADVVTVDPKDRETARGTDNIQLHEWISTAYTQVNINTAVAPITDMRVRQALSHSLNRQAILDAIFFGEGEVANGPITKASWAYNENLLPIPEDLDKAKQLLDAAGYGDGLAFEMVIVADETRTPLSEMMKAQWARIGVDMTIVARSAEEAGAEYRNQLYPMFLTFFSGRADPDMTIYENFHSQGGFNRAKFNEAFTPGPEAVAIDQKIEAARQIYDQDERKALYDEIQTLLMEQAFGILFTHRTNAVALSSRVEGFQPYGDGKYRFHELSLKA